ncbi:hypothetical protein LMTR3_22845 [Bradyrhizobium sp. LMTR 3]|nr:hypothetical protein LMTR3_22845 [Bradyrhizobium sp. LMTR 3]
MPSSIIQHALRASLLGREMEMIRSLIDSENDAAIKTASEVWAYGEQWEIRLPMKVWRHP